MTRLKSALLVAAVMAATPAMAAYPDRPVKVVVPYAAGGPADVTARRDSHLYFLPTAAFDELVRTRPGAWRVISTALIDKLALVNRGVSTSSPATAITFVPLDDAEGTRDFVAACVAEFGRLTGSARLVTPADAAAALGPGSSGLEQATWREALERESSIVAALANTPRDTKLNLDALNQASDYWEAVRAWYKPFDSGMSSGTAEVYLHEMPGGQFTNLKEQAEAMGLGPKWGQIARAYADARITSIYGGTTEVMLNILGERVLGLPGDVRVDRDVAWSKVPRN